MCDFFKKKYGQITKQLDSANKRQQDVMVVWRQTGALYLRLSKKGENPPTSFIHTHPLCPFLLFISPPPHLPSICLAPSKMNSRKTVLGATPLLTTHPYVLRSSWPPLNTATAISSGSAGRVLFTSFPLIKLEFVSQGKAIWATLTN